MDTPRRGRPKVLPPLSFDTPRIIERFSKEAAERAREGLRKAHNAGHNRMSWRFTYNYCFRRIMRTATKELGTYRMRELANAMNWLDHCGCWIANPWQCPVCNEHAVILDTGFAATCDECGARFIRRSIYSKEWERENPSI